MSETVRVASRFRGPPGMGNGGYVAGCMAAGRAGPLEVRLRAPIPLERDLELDDDGSGGRILRDGERTLALAAPAAQPLEDPPERCDLDTARRLAGQCRALRTHPFPGCFVCGPDRAPGDGLRILPGAVGPDLVAAAWEPGQAAADGSTVPEPLVWAALDCPTAFPLLEPESARALEPMVLGRLAAELCAPVPAAQPLLVLAWTIERGERGGVAGSAVVVPDGPVLARARATWVSMAGRMRAESGATAQ